MIQILVLFLVFLIIFYLVNKSLKKYLKNDVKEHYLTFFLPFYDANTNELTNFYANNDDNKNYVKKKFNYDNIKIATIDYDKFFAQILINYYLSKSYTVDSSVVIYKDKLQSIIDLNNNKINFSLNNDYASYIYVKDIMKIDLSNIRLVSSIYKEYIYMFTKKKYGIYSIKNIPPKFVIGILNNPDSFYYYYKRFLENMGYTENVNYILKLYNKDDDLFNAFLNDKCNMMIRQTVFPDNKIYSFLDNSINEAIILLPFETYNDDLFLKKNPSLDVDYIDLNKISKSYLPRKFGKNEYTVFRPNLKIAYNKTLLLSNINTNKVYTYSFIKFLYENYKQVNNNTASIGYQIDKIQIEEKYSDYLEYHEGVLQYFTDIGYISNINNNNCQYLVGKMACTDENLKNNNLGINY